MEILGDNLVVTPGLIKGEEYSFLIESKTALFVQSPDFGSPEPGRKFSLFFLAMSIASMIGIVLNRQGAIFLLPLLVVAATTFWSLVKSFVKSKPREAMWRLYLGSGEPVLIYSSPDAEAFAAKRNEIERTLLGRPLSEEE